ncbi:MAG: single-stranded-DNA-specific exonuclease RecJ [Patescibacteria group bacterium]
MKIIFNHEIKSGDDIDGNKLVDLILRARKVENAAEFMNPPHPDGISLFHFDKSYEKKFEKVIKILRDIKKDNGMIVVYTDYDADGITGGAIMWETLNLLGFKVMPYVPDRKTEGYGFSIKGIDNVINLFNPSLIISVDHGITKIREIEYAAKKNIKVIVTDHHLKGEDMPDKASAIFHVPSLSGSGVSYFFSRAVRDALIDQIGKNGELDYNFKYDYLALAATGIIADLVPLVGPSRSVVKYGLAAYSKVKRHGITEIIDQAGLKGKAITPYEIGFVIAPRINAIGRLGHAIDALRLLCTRTREKAFELARKVGSVNQERQALVEKSVTEAESMIPKNVKKIILLVSEHWNEGIIGLIASKILEKYYRPVIVMTKNNGFYKGSARSIPSLNITSFLKSLRKYLVDVGGHAAAAGFTIDAKKTKQFVEAAERKAERELSENDLEKTVIADIKIPASRISLEVIKALERLEPFGVGNPRPVFLSEGQVTGASIFGKTNSHLKVFLDGIEMISFGKAQLFSELERGMRIRVAYIPEVDSWGGRQRLRAKLLSFIAD